MNINHRLTVLDAIFAQRDQVFDCLSIMNYIRENEVNNLTIPHQEIAMYLDTLRAKGWIKYADRSCEFTKYQTVTP
jgi:hypothetical protein